MFQRFEWIRDGGYFGDSRWPIDLPDFERINVVYGPTGSGKTSLARVLESLRPDRDGCRRVSAVVGDDGQRRTTDGGDDPIFGRVMVFSEGYVERSHRFGGARPDMDAILTLGVRTVEDEDALQLLREERDGLVAEQSTLTEKKQGLDEALRAAYERVSIAVVGDLASAGGMYASRGNYSSKMAKKRMEELGGWLAALPPAELAGYKGIADQRAVPGCPAAEGRPGAVNPVR
jgi:energy-coupling factor transporter ATP-binding protein EcfA2